MFIIFNLLVNQLIAYRLATREEFIIKSLSKTLKVKILTTSSRSVVSLIFALADVFIQPNLTVKLETFPLGVATGRSIPDLNSDLKYILSW